MAVITHDEEVALARRSRGGDREAEGELLARHVNFVRYVARRFRGLGVPTEDLVQVGCLALLRAIRRFDPENGSRLTSYAHRFIFGAMCQAVSNAARSRMEQLDVEDLGRVESRDGGGLDGGSGFDLGDACERCLDPVERRVIGLRYGDLRTLSYRKVAAILRRSKPDVGRIHRRAIAKLRLAVAGASAA